jgi:ABC-type iron transport system FetAB permease component
MAHSGWHGFKRELIVSTGSTIFLLGIFAAILLLISKVEDQKMLWVSVSLAGTLVGWILVRTKSKNFFDTFEQLFSRLLSAMLSPFNW